MPATSPAQRRLFAIAEHHPDQLYDKNKGLANLPQNTLHDFAATKESSMPKRRNYGEEGETYSDEGNWISEATSKPGFRKGALTRKATAAGMSPMSFARKHYGDSGRTGAQSRFAINATQK
jgi:hypothetical protein